MLAVLAPMVVVAAALPAAAGSPGKRRIPANPGPSGPEVADGIGRFAQGALDLLERSVPRPPGGGPYHPVAGPFRYGFDGGRYGAPRGGRLHEGQDVFAPAGTPLIAVRDGVVVEKGDDGGRGNYIALYSGIDRRTYNYLHMQSPSPLLVGERVRAGTLVGRLGCTGSCWGDHLHFEVRRGRGANGATSDPLPFLRRWQQRRAPISP
jgi:murein DD-endopeptidase MepM/ murein hydrolase activator NlpD